jgi:hypothetical protein
LTNRKRFLQSCAMRSAQHLSNTQTLPSPYNVQPLAAACRNFRRAQSKRPDTVNA